MLAELHVFYEAAYEGMMARRTKDVTGHPREMP
jgi:hypothetical protein